MNKVLTVSIAAYNVEKYLDQTLSSLAPGTFKYVQKENGGHGSTINKGIELATGKYFRVVDGDDWVDTDQFNLFVEKLKTTDADLILTQCKIIEENRESFNLPIKNLENGKIYRWNDIENFDQIGLSTTTVKTCLLKNNNVRITEKCYYVDIEYTIWALYYSNTIMYLELPVYMYRKSNVSQSTSKKNMLKNVAMQERVAKNVCKMYSSFLTDKELCNSKSKAIYNRVVQSVGSTFRTYLLFKSSKESKERIIEFDNEIKGISPEIFNMLGKKKFIKLMRMGSYAFVPLFRILYRIWILKY